MTSGTEQSSVLGEKWKEKARWFLRGVFKRQPNKLREEQMPGKTEPLGGGKQATRTQSL